MRALAVVVVLAGCAPALSVAPLPGWHPVRSDAETVTLRGEKGGTIAAHAACHDADDAPLDVLTNHLLFGLEGKREHSRVRFTLADRAAMRTRVDAVVDGITVALDVVVLSKDRCVYDLMLVAPPERLAQLTPDFDRFVAQFQPAAPR